jgi:hypothetical protein
MEGLTMWGRMTRAARSAMCRRLVLAGLAAASLAASPAAAAAGQDPGLRLGYYGSADADEPVPVVGLYGRFDIPGPLNLELSADYRKEQLHKGAIESTVVPLRASAVLNLFPGVSPYLLAGLGVDYNSISFPHSAFADETNFVFEAHAGVGLELSLGPLSIIGDVRYCAVSKVSNAHLNQVLGHDYDPSGWYASIAAGISF